ncbi:hypothetical protein CLV92_102131 [Kineococcus xinjiangensis]|uniref:Uncharacterized protein n=1 Tax=Kineococcus xinjiangensis TaxID=512762 RepID=A0A2S6IUN2_9ACTN|nr:hypothetical protein CLV92_102131 [Kineococcus xinjiangensis]
MQDAHEVLQWARKHAEGRTPVVYVEALDDGQLGLLRLHGADPNAAAPEPGPERMASAKG